MPQDTDRDRQLSEKARRLGAFADELTDWATQFNPRRRQQQLAPLAERTEFDLLQLRRRAANLLRSSRMPVAAAVYGPSQVGKSLFIGQVMCPHDPARSPLGIEERALPPAYYPDLSFTDHLNPVSNIEATALVTRFTTKDRLPTSGLAEYPVLVRSLCRADWLKVLARGTLAVGAGGSRWDGVALEKLFAEARTRGSGGEDRLWTLDLFDAYDYLHRYDEHRFAADPAQFYRLLTARSLADAGYVHVAAKLFWEQYPELTRLFERVCGLIKQIEATNQEGILVPWSAARFLLDSQRTGQYDPDKKPPFGAIRWTDFCIERPAGWIVLAHRPGQTSNERLDLADVQAALLEMVIPVMPHRMTEDWGKVLAKTDLLDLPGMRADQGGGAEGKLDDAVSVEKQMQIVKRGKVSFLFDHYIDELQIQTLFLLARMGNLEVKGFMKGAMEKWGRARYGDNWPQRVPTDPTALFVGLTGIDLGFQNHTAPPPDLFDNFLRELMTHLEPSVNNYGGVGQPFRNVFPIRYPGTLDQTVEKQRSLGPKKWEQAGTVFARSEEVRKHVAEPERRWQIAMMDKDGGLSLIADGILKATDSGVKQAQLEQNLNKARAEIVRLAGDLVVDGNTNVRREARLAMARKVLGLLTEDASKAFYRAQVVFQAFCLKEPEVEPIADLRDGPNEAFQVRTEEPRQRLRKKLEDFLNGWAVTAPDRWADGERDWPGATPWLEPGSVRDLVNGVRDYLLSPELLGGLVETLAPVIELRTRDEMAGRHARRKYTWLLLNDYLTNPGPDSGPLGEAFPINGKDFGLMTPFVERWCHRLPGCLAEGAGREVLVPPGNDDLKALLQKHR